MKFIWNLITFLLSFLMWLWMRNVQINAVRYEFQTIFTVEQMNEPTTKFWLRINKHISHTPVYFCCYVDIVHCTLSIVHPIFGRGEFNFSTHRLPCRIFRQQNLFIVHCSYTHGEMAGKTWSCIEYVWNKNPSIKSILIVHMCFTVVISEQIFAFFHFSILTIDQKLFDDIKLNTHKCDEGVNKNGR